MIETRDIPVKDIPTLSDDRWQQMARENAVHNFIRENGREPGSVDEAVQWQRSRVDQEDVDNIRDGPIMQATKWIVPAVIWMTGMWMVVIVVMALAMEVRL